MSSQHFYRWPLVLYEDTSVAGKYVGSSASLQQDYEELC